jgi:hypothetical protein
LHRRASSIGTQATGAPRLDLVVTNAGGVAVYAPAQRPHAALLFADSSSAPGQKLLEDLFFGSARKDYGFKRWYPEKGGTLAQYEESLDVGTSYSRKSRRSNGSRHRFFRFAQFENLQ